MTKTSGIKYMGSKQKFINNIIEQTECLIDNNKNYVILDVFTGTTKVAQGFRQKNRKVLTSDLLWASEAYSYAYICNPTSKRNNLEEIIDILNNISPEEGWITQNYCEVVPKKSSDNNKKLVNAFTRDNGMKADAIREEIEKYRKSISHWEYMTLITSLILALDKVQNSQGHSRAFFREFIVPNSKKPLKLLLPNLIGNPNLISIDSDEDFIEKFPIGAHFTGNVSTKEYVEFIQKNTNEKDHIIGYLDPPYTVSAKYNLFYHLWDSIFRWDKPEVGGATNRRIDRIKTADGEPDLSSEWTNNLQAKDAFINLFEKIPFVKDFVISYNNESILSEDDMKNIFKELDFYVINTYKKKYVRHALSKSGKGGEQHKNANMDNIEYIFTISKNKKENKTHLRW